MTTQEIIEVIKGLSVLELNDLVKACEEEFGVSAAAGVVVAAGFVAVVASDGFVAVVSDLFVYVNSNVLLYPVAVTTILYVPSALMHLLLSPMFHLH